MTVAGGARSCRTAPHDFEDEHEEPCQNTACFDPRTIDPNRVPTGLKVLIAASFMIAVGFGLVAPVLPNYAQNFNATVTMATMVVSALAITRLIFCAVGGSDDYPVG